MTKIRNSSKRHFKLNSSSGSFHDKLMRSSTCRYTFISVLVVLLSILYNKPNTENLMEFPLVQLLDFLQKQGMSMMGLINALDRSLVAGRGLEQGWKLLEIPRSLQIWTLDALRDPYVKQNLFGAKHLQTKQPLASKAYLGAHLAIQIKHQERANKHSFYHNREIAKQKFQKAYLDFLPTFEDLKRYHPVSFDYHELKERFGQNMYFFLLVSRRKAEIKSEYEAFSHVCSDFQNMIKFDEYVAARLNVQTRTFRSGPLDEVDASKEELELYKTYLGIDLHGGSSAMVAVMDALNAHHEKQNVQYKYIPESKKFLLYASKDVRQGTELFTSYGDRADLYPTYGFVNGDFSERTTALFAFHQIVDRRIVPKEKYEDEQKKQIQRYLQYDDGYSACITDENTIAMDFKRLKRRLLLLTLNDYRKWIASLPRRSEDPSSTVKIDDGVHQLISTCRLLALTHRDYNGTAPEMIQEKIEEVEQAQRSAPHDFHGESYNLIMKRGNKSLEYRAGVWLQRLAVENINRLAGTGAASDQLAKLQTLPQDSKAWTATYVLYQELQTLETLKVYSEHVVRKAGNASDDEIDHEGMITRSNLCPDSSPALQKLLNE